MQSWRFFERHRPCTCVWVLRGEDPEAELFASDFRKTLFGLLIRGLNFDSSLIEKTFADVDVQFTNDKTFTFDDRIIRFPPLPQRPTLFIYVGHKPAVF